MKYIKKLIRNSKRALNQQVIKKKQEIVKYAPRLTGIQVKTDPRSHCGSEGFVFVRPAGRLSIQEIPQRRYHGRGACKP